MPFALRLSKALRQAGWKVRIHDDERLEIPHATIYKKLRKWRLSLRDKTFLDRGDKWSQIDKRLRQAIEDESSWEALQQAWDDLHPQNPVKGQAEEEGAADDQAN